MKKRIFSILLAVVMLLGMIPGTALTAFAASAAPADNVRVDIGNTTVYLNREQGFYLVNNQPSQTGTLGVDGCTAHLDSATGILTLHNYSGGSIYTAGSNHDLIVKLIGNNTITTDRQFGLCSDTNITITSTSEGSLTINSTRSSGNMAGISANFSGSVDAGSVIIGGNANITLTATNSTTAGDYVYGVFAYKSLEINDAASLAVSVSNPNCTNSNRAIALCDYGDSGITFNTTGDVTLDTTGTGSLSYTMKASAINLVNVGTLTLKFKKSEAFRNEASTTITYDSNSFTETQSDTTTIATSVYSKKVAPSTYAVSLINCSATPSGAQEEGTEITLMANAAPTGKEFDRWVVSGVTVENENSVTTTFIMPANPVSAEATYKDSIYNIKVNNGEAQVSGGTAVTTATYGTPITLFAEETPGGAPFSHWVVNSGTVSFNPNETYRFASFIMPDEHVEITAVYELVPVITITTQPTGGTFTEGSISGNLSVVATSDPERTLTYAWTIVDPQTGATQFGGNHATVAIPTDLTPGTYEVYCEITANLIGASKVKSKIVEIVVKETYDVNFNANGGTGTMDPETGFSAGDSFTLPVCGFMFPKGKVFAGWALTSNGEIINTATITITENTILYAQWEDDLSTPHNIDVHDGTAKNSVGGSITQSIQKETVTISAGIAPAGQAFEKWEVVSGGVTLADATAMTTTFEMPYDNVEIRAIFKNASVTIGDVTFESVKVGYDRPTHKNVVVTNNGEATLKNVQVTLDSGSEHFDLLVNSAFGNMAAGAAKDTNCTIQPKANLAAGTYTAVIKLTADNLAAPVTKSVTFVVDELDIYNVVINLTNCSIPETTVKNVTEGQNYGVKFYPADGYKLDNTCIKIMCGSTEVTGWTLNAANELNIPAAQIKGDLTITVTPKENFTVIFNSNGGTGTMTSITGISTGSITLPACGFTAPNGKVFAGWAWTFDGEIITTATVAVTANSTLYAQWKDDVETKFTVTVNGGTATPNSVAQKTTVTIEAGTAPAGQAFEKWEVVSGGVTLEDANAMTTTFEMPYDNVEIRAIFKNASVTIGDVTFESVKVGYDRPTHKNVVVTNTGEATLKNVQVTLESGDEYFDLLVHSAFGNMAAGKVEDTSCTIQPKANLAAGTYTAVIKLTADNLATPVTKEVTFVVAALATYNITFEGTNYNHAGNATVTEGQNYGVRLYPSENYKIDNTCIKIMCGGAEVTGWTLNTNLEIDIPAAKITGDLTIKVTPVFIEHTITFNANGGSVGTASATTTNGKLASLPTPTHRGSYTFNGWYTAANGGTKITTDTVFTADATIYAKWTFTVGGSVTPPAHTHDYGTTWKFDGTNHWKECSCGDKKEVTAHSGGTATCEAKAKCSECNTEYGELAEHKYSEATCTAKAKCSVCGDEKGELAPHSYVEGKCSCGATDPNYVPPHEHSFVEGKCECGETDPNYVPPHEHSFVEGKCECGETDPNYTPETNVPGTDVPGTDTPGTDDPQTPDDNDGLGTGAIVGIVIGAVVVLGGGGFALYWFVFKKKRI